MRWFSRNKPKGYLGVDIGSGGIKLVELVSEKGRSRLVTYGYSERSAGETLAPLEQPQATADLLRKIHKESGAASTVAISALPLSSVFSTIVSVPYQKDDRKMKEAIQGQVRKLTPLPLEDMITYSTFIDPVPKKEEKVSDLRVLVTGSAKTLVQNYIQIFKLAKLELKALDTESFALIRALIGKDKSSVMVVDIGYRRSNITVVEKGIPFYTRSIQLGGATVTEQLMQQMSIGEEEAEQMKRDVAMFTSPTGSGDPGMPAVLESFLQPLLNEIRYSLEWYQKMDMRENQQVEKVILTGGSSHLPQLAPALAHALNKNVYVGDPLARVIYPEPLRPVLDEIGPRLAVSLGLAMREFE